MAKTRQQKEDQLKALNKVLDSKGVVFFNYGGLNVAEVEELRAKLREENSTMAVAKRKLVYLALEEKGITVEDSVINGPIAVVSADDEVMPAKIVADFKKDHETVSFYGGMMESAFIDEAKVEHLASLPGKQELLAQAVGSIAAPLSGLVNVLSGNLRGLVNVLHAVKEQKS